jgi:hypothetical protein
MLTLTPKQARELGFEVPAESKYKSQKTELDGIKFDSAKEANRYAELKLMLMAGEIVSLELQPEYILQEKYKRPDGRPVRAIKYRADFRITYPDGRIVVIDVKPSKNFKTSMYRLKVKLLLKKYPGIIFEEEE